MRSTGSTRELRRRVRKEDGIALVVSLMAMMLLMALGMALLMTTTTETKIAANYAGGTEALYAPDGSMLDLGEATDVLNCGKLTSCSDADLNAVTDDRPWGLNNPRWTLYAYG